MAQYYVNGSAAVKYEEEALEREEALQQPQRQLTVLPGSRPRTLRQEQTQAALSPLAVTGIKCAVAFVAVVAVAAIVRIALIAVAFGFASSNATLETELDEARSLGSELEVQQSVYGSADRITSLATDVYGMVPADSVAVIDLSAAAVDAAPADDGAQIG